MPHTQTKLALIDSSILFIGNSFTYGSGLNVRSPDEQTYLVVLGFAVDVVSASESALGGSFRVVGGKLYFYYKEQSLRQEFAVLKQ